MKMLSRCLAGLCIVALAVSCTPVPPGGPAEKTPTYDLEVYGDLARISPERQVIVLWYPYTQRREELLLAMIDAFNAGNRWGIVVVGEFGGTGEALFDDILARAEERAGLPQVVIAERCQVAAYAARGIAVSLDPYLASERWGYTRAELRDFFPGALTGDMLPQFDARYGWPVYQSAEVLYYNEDWLAELGYAGPPTTWPAFVEMACAASVPEAGTFGYEFSGDDATFASMLFNRGGRLVNGDGSAYAFGDDAGQKTLSSVQWLFREKCAVPKVGRSGDLEDFAAGKVLFTIDSTSNLPAYRDSVVGGAGFTWAIAPLPTTLDSPVVYVHGPAFAVLEATPEKQLAAWLFLKWFAEPEQQARWTRAFGTLPLRASAAEYLESYLVEHPRYRDALGFLEGRSAIEPGVTGYGACRASIEGMLAEVAGGGDPGAALAAATEACNVSLEETARP